MKKIYFTFKDKHVYRLGSSIALNLMARSISENLKDSSIRGLSIPNLLIFNEPGESYDKDNPRLLKVNSNISSKLIAHTVSQGNYDGVVLNSNGLWYPNFNSQKFFLQDKANKLLKTRGINKLFGLDFLIHLRLGDVVDPLFYRKEKYFPLNIDYYKKIADEVGLTPTFVGQLSKSKYLDEIQKNFPESQFYNPDSIDAFLSIMTAKTKVLSISSFCWFAAWCGNNNTSIYFPVAGLYDPFQFSNNFLIPFDDDRYLFEYYNKNKFSNTKVKNTSRLKKLCNYFITKYINLKYPEN